MSQPPRATKRASPLVLMASCFLGLLIMFVPAACKQSVGVAGDIGPPGPQGPAGPPGPAGDAGQPGPGTMRVDGEQDSQFITSGISWGTIANAQVSFQTSSTTRVDFLATGSVATSTDAGTVSCAFRFNLDGTGFGDNLYGERAVTVSPQQWVSFVVDHHETVGAGSHTVTLQGARPDGLSECFIDALPYTKVRVLATFR